MEGGDIMLRDENFAATGELNQEQFDFAFGFVEIVFEADLQTFWSLVSEVDQARAYETYKSVQDSYTNFEEYIASVRENVRSLYSPVQDNAGISQTVRYTDDGEAYIYLFENVQEPEVYEEATEKKVFPVRISYESFFDEGSINLRLKARVYDDSHKEKPITTV